VESWSLGISFHHVWPARRQTNKLSKLNNFSSTTSRRNAVPADSEDITMAPPVTIKVSNRSMQLQLTLNRAQELT